MPGHINRATYPFTPPPSCAHTSVLLLVDASIPPMALDLSCAAWFAEAQVHGAAEPEPVSGRLLYCRLVCPTACTGKYMQ